MAQFYETSVSAPVARNAASAAPWELGADVLASREIALDAAKASVALTDVRIVLAQLSFASGANNQISVLRAQSAEKARAVTIQGGSITLTDLLKEISAFDAQDKVLGPRGFQVPVAIWPDAKLVLEDGDVLNLSRPDGAFVANFGVLQVKGAKIAGVGPVNPNDESFRPFVATAGAGFSRIHNSDFENLGFGKSAAFAGVSFLSGGLYPVLGRNIITNSAFRNVGTLTLKGVEDAVIRQNAFVRATNIAISVRGGAQTQVLENIFVSTDKGSALKVFEGASQTAIIGNVVLRAAGHGIEVDGAGDLTEIRDNVVWSNANAGILVRRSDCVNVLGNSVLKNKNRGISIRTTRASKVLENDIFANRGAGLHIAQQPIGTNTVVQDNNLVANQIGLSSASSAALSLYRNDFSDQFPRLLDGDLTNQSEALFKDLRGSDPTTLTSGGIELFGLAALDCTIPVIGKS